MLFTCEKKNHWLQPLNIRTTAFPALVKRDAEYDREHIFLRVNQPILQQKKLQCI